MCRCRSIIPSATASSRETLMRRLFADRLVLATGVILILMSILFAYLRVAG
jgi:hypothetical protein